MKALLTRLLCGAVILLLAPGAVFAQDGTLSGTVTDGQTGDPLPGATVQVQELGIGSATDIDGNFEFDVPAGEHVVSVSFIGYRPAEKTVTVTEGETTGVDFALTPRTEELDEVVVTAQNIERQAKSLGYSVSQLDSDDIAKTKETNIVNSLQAKVPGLQITQQSGNVGGGASIILRGVASLTGSNQPLFVVDGVPIFNSDIRAGASGGGRITNSTDTGNLAQDINPEDVESVTVLKGGAAAARYGARARNGAIIITTKRGTDRPNTSVSVSSSLNFNTPVRLPDYQNEYAQGTEGTYDREDLNGWGPRINGQVVQDFRDRRVALQASPNNVQDFYQTGIFANNSVSVSNSGDFGDFRLSLTNVTQEGIVPTSSLDRNTISFNAGSDLAENVTARVTANYVSDQTRNRVRSGGNSPSALVSVVNFLPRTVAISDLRDFRDPNGDQITLANLENNPFWILNESPFTTGRERIFGSAQLGYQPIEVLEFSARFGTDYYSEDRESIFGVGSLGNLDGAFGEDNYQERQVDVDFIANYDQDLTEDINVKLLLGNNINYRSYQRRSNSSSQLAVAGLYAYANATSNTPTNFFSEQSLVGVFGTATFGFRDYAFAEVTGRNDWSSTLPKENNSYFYPSLNLSLVVSDLLAEEFDLESNVLSYAKVRGNIAQVGSDTEPYNLRLGYNPISQSFGQFNTFVEFPFGGVTGFEADAVLPNANLEPEIQTSWELGTELGLFSGRVNMDVTYYNQTTTDAIVDLPSARSSGFFSRLVNIGEIKNTGVEAVVNATVLNFTDLIGNQDVSWRTNVNFSRNNNEVVDLGDISEFDIGTGFNGFTVQAREGESLQITGPDWLRDPETGQVIIDPETGLRQEGAQNESFGELYPDFSVGFGNEFSIGPVSFGFLLDWQKGGKVYSNTVQALRSSGLAAETAANRGGTFVDDGILVERDPVTNEIISRRPNDVPVQTMQDFWSEYTGGGDIIGAGVFDADYVKLREATLSVNLPTRLVERTFLTNASLTFQGRNLLLLYSRVPHIDPETNLFGAGSAIGRGYEFNNLPNTRTFGVTLDLSF